jgi:hypothetical protein
MMEATKVALAFSLRAFVEDTVVVGWHTWVGGVDRHRAAVRWGPGAADVVGRHHTHTGMEVWSPEWALGHF